MIPNELARELVHEYRSTDIRANSTEGMYLQKGKFPPIDEDILHPPSLQEWKQSQGSCIGIGGCHMHQLAPQYGAHPFFGINNHPMTSQPRITTQPCTKKLS